MSLELTAPIVLKDEEKRIVTGPVLVPGEKDADGDIVTKGQIENAAYKYLADYRIIDVSHQLNKKAYPVESWLTRKSQTMKAVTNGEEFGIPEGTWMMSAKVEEDEDWMAVKNGELTGFSIMAIRGDASLKSKEDVRAAAKGGELSLKDIKEVTLAELGENFVVPIVSLAPQPKVPKSKYVAIKSEPEEPEEPDETVGFLKKIYNLLKSENSEGTKAAKKEGRELSKDNTQRLETALAAAVEIEQIIQNMIGKEEEEEPNRGFMAKNKGGQNNMGDEKQNKEEEVITQLSSTLSEINSSFKDFSEKFEELESRLDKLEEEPETDETDETEEEVDEKEQEQDEEIEALKSELKEMEGMVSSMKSAIIPGQRSIKGQDGDEEEDEEGQAKNTGGVQRNALGVNIEKGRK